MADTLGKASHGHMRVSCHRRSARTLRSFMDGCLRPDELLFCDVIFCFVSTRCRPGSRRERGRKRTRPGAMHAAVCMDGLLDRQICSRPGHLCVTSRQSRHGHRGKLCLLVLTPWVSPIVCAGVVCARCCVLFLDLLEGHAAGRTTFPVAPRARGWPWPPASTVGCTCSRPYTSRRKARCMERDARCAT